MWFVFVSFVFMIERLPNLLTRSTLQKLYEALREASQQKSESLKSIGESARPGDWHDNFALEQAHRDSDLADANLRLVRDMLHNYEIIEPVHTTDSVKIGNRVVIQYVGEDEEEIYTIGGPADRLYNKGFISNVSPLGKALLGRKAGDIVEFGKNLQVKVIKILPSNFD